MSSCWRSGDRPNIGLYSVTKKITFGGKAIEDGIEQTAQDEIDLFSEEVIILPLLNILYLLSCRGLNLIWNLGVVDPGLKTRGSWVLKVKQMETRSTGLRVYLIKNFYLIMHKFFYLWKVTTFGKCSHLIFCRPTLYRTIIFHGDPIPTIRPPPRPPHPKIWGHNPSQPLGLTYMLAYYSAGSCLRGTCVHVDVSVYWTGAFLNIILK